MREPSLSYLLLVYWFQHVKRSVRLECSASSESTKPSRNKPRSHASELTGAAPNAVGASWGGSNAPVDAASFKCSAERATPLSLVRASLKQLPVRQFGPLTKKRPRVEPRTNSPSLSTPTPSTS